MPGIVTRDEVVQAMANATTYGVNKASIANMLAGGFASLWRATGTPAQGSPPTTAAICTDALTGSLGTVPTPGAGQRNALLLAQFACSTAGPGVEIVDRLAHMGGLSGTVTTAQTVGVSVASLVGTRVRAGYEAVRWWVEIYTDIGTTAATATVTYVDSGGTTRTTTLTLGGASPANRAGRLFPIQPQAATPLPIESVTSLQLSGSTLVAGNFGVTADVVLSPMAMFGVANYPTVADWAGLGAPTVHEDACLALVQLCTTTSTGTLLGSVRLGTA